MASRKPAVAVVLSEGQIEEQIKRIQEPEEPEEAPYDLEPLNDQTRRIVLQWGQATTNRVAELKMSGANEWARFLEDIFNTVGMFVEGE